MHGWELFDDAAKPDLVSIRSRLGTPRGFDDASARGLRDALPAIDTRPQTIEAADAAQHQLIELFDAHRHRAAAFLTVYHGITVAVIDALARGILTPKPFFVRLAGKFAERLRRRQGRARARLHDRRRDVRAVAAVVRVRQPRARR